MDVERITKICKRGTRYHSQPGFVSRACRCGEVYGSQKRISVEKIRGAFANSSLVCGPVGRHKIKRTKLWFVFCTNKIAEGWARATTVMGRKEGKQGQGCLFHTVAKYIHCLIFIISSASRNKFSHHPKGTEKGNRLLNHSQLYPTRASRTYFPVRHFGVCTINTIRSFDYFLWQSLEIVQSSRKLHNWRSGLSIWVPLGW